MPTVSQWTLPLNPPNSSPFYLRDISEERRHKLYYTKYIVNVIGELDVAATVDNVREWVLPPQIYAPRTNADPIGITYGPGDQDLVWFALQSAQRLAVLDPATGLFISYGGKGFPFGYPGRLMFDRSGALWYTAQTGTSGGLLGRLSPRRTVATYWDLPIALLWPEGLWVQSNGEVVWFSPTNPNRGMTGGFLGRLEVATNQLTYWSFPPPGRAPAGAGTGGFPADEPADIWFTYDAWGTSSRVFRFELSTGDFYEYASPSVIASPRRLAFDPDGNAWVSDLQGRITAIARTANCGTTRFVATTVTVKPIRRRVNKKQAPAQPAVHTAAPTHQAVPRVRSACQTDFPLPHPLTSDAIQMSAVPGERPNVYFATPSGNVIGRLQP